MDSLLTRYRNISFLLLMILAQLMLLAYQVRNGEDVRLIRVWAVTAVTPLARTLEGTRSGVVGFFRDYVAMRDIRDEHRKLQEEVGKLKMENQFLKSELATADRARALALFQTRTPSRTIAARVINTGAGTGSKVVYVDRGSIGAGVEKGMAVVTPDGIVGKVINVFPTASQVLLITDPNFAAGVISQKHRVRATLKGQGYSTCKVDYVQPEEKVEVGEWFYTSGDDRVFPKGMPAGQVKVVRSGSPFLDIVLDPSGFQSGLEEVLIVLEGVHSQIPEVPQPSNLAVYLAPPPPPETETGDPGTPAEAGPGTEADRLRLKYKAIGEAQGHVFGSGGPGARPPNFNMPATTQAPAGSQGSTPPSAPPATSEAKPAPPPPSEAQPVRPQQ